MLGATVYAHLKFMVSVWASVPKSWSVFSPNSSHWSDENHYLFLQPLLHTCMVPSQPQEARLLIYSLHLFNFFLSSENLEFEVQEKHLQKKAPAPSFEQGFQQIQTRQH